MKQGWTDALRKAYPKTPLYTFWDYRRNRWQRDAGLRIDHLLLRKSLKGRLIDAAVDRAVQGVEGASDHVPAWIELSDSGGGPRLAAEHLLGLTKPTPCGPTARHVGACGCALPQSEGPVAGTGDHTMVPVNQSGLFWPSGRHLFKRRSRLLVRVGWGLVLIAVVCAVLMKGL